MGFFSAAQPDAVQLASLEGGGDRLMQPSRSTATLGFEAGRFQKGEMAREGGLGEIFYAQDIQFPRVVALKQIRRKHIHSETVRHKFRLEAMITGKLEHPGIVPIYAFGADQDGHPFYAMRFIRGERLTDSISSFHQRVNAGQVHFESSELRALLRRLIDVCNAIQYAHEQGFLHRDLKPDNIMVGKHGETLVVDWGLAKDLRAGGDLTAEADLAVTDQLLNEQVEEVALTRTGSFMGTAAYASPEQLRGEIKLLSPASDIYCLGGILYTILLNKPPIHAAQSRSECLKQIDELQSVNWTDLRADIPKPLAFICSKALSKEPADRFADVNQFRDHLQLWLDDQAVPGMREGVSVRLSRWGRQHQRLATSAVLLLIMVALGTGILAFLRNQHAVALNAANKQEQAERAKAVNAQLDLLLNTAQLARSRDSMQSRN